MTTRAKLKPGTRIAHIPISVAADADLLAATVAGAGKKIVVTGFFLVCAAAETIQFTSGTGPTALTGVMSFAANGGVVAVLGGDTVLLECGENQKLSINLGGTAQVSGALSYAVIDANE